MRYGIFFVLCAAAGCAPAPKCPPTAEAAPATAIVAASAEPDPDVIALAEAAKKCPFSSGSFSWDCPAFKEWREESDDLFEGPGGNAAIIKLLEDTDVRSRTLATERGFSAGRSFFSDKERAKRLFAVVDKEREGALLGRYGKFVAQIDGEKLFPAEFRAFAKHPSSDFRRSLGEYLLPARPTPFSLELVKALIDDPDAAVRRTAMKSLSGSGRTRSSEGICATLKSHFSREDSLAEEALEAGATSKCGLVEAVVAEVEKRSASGKLTESGAPNVLWALGSVCNRADEPIKRRVFDVAVKMAPKVEDSWRRRSWIDLFRSCDVARASEALKPYLTDADKDVADNAKSETERVAEQLKPQ